MYLVFLSFREAHFSLFGYFSLYCFLVVISLRNPWATEKQINATNETMGIE